MLPGMRHVRRCGEHSRQHALPGARYVALEPGTKRHRICGRRPNGGHDNVHADWRAASASVPMDGLLMLLAAAR